MMKRTSSGVALRRMLITIEFIATDLPEPVVPATSTCGALARSITYGIPSMSLPSAIVSLLLARWNTSCSTISLRNTVSRSRFGTSMPTTPLPGMGATMRTRIASIAIARSSASEAIFDTLMPGPGRNSYIVTTGPGRISTTSPTMPKSASLARSFSAVVRNASLSSALRSGLVEVEHVERGQGELRPAAHELELVLVLVLGRLRAAPWARR